MEQKRGEGKERFKKGGKLVQGVGALKRGGGAGTPLRTKGVVKDGEVVGV